MAVTKVERIGESLIEFCSDLLGLEIDVSKAARGANHLKGNNPPAMSWDFWAGYTSGAIGIIIGSPLDLAKVQKQAGYQTALANLVNAHHSKLQRYASLARGSLAPVLGYGALNGLLFATYNRTLFFLDPSIRDVTQLSNTSSWTIWLAGAAGGLASWTISAPTELIKCRKQLGDVRSMSQQIRDIRYYKGLSQLYRGGAITSVRDAVGYGFYFWTYETCKSFISVNQNNTQSALQVMLCGGVAGVATWVSVYPLDVVKTHVQGADMVSLRNYSILNTQSSVIKERMSTWAVFRHIYLHGGTIAFFRGLGVCSMRAFLVNAVQWYIYEKIMNFRLE